METRFYMWFEANFAAYKAHPLRWLVDWCNAIADGYGHRVSVHLHPIGMPPTFVPSWCVYTIDGYEEFALPPVRSWFFEYEDRGRNEHMKFPENENKG